MPNGEEDILSQSQEIKITGDEYQFRLYMVRNVASLSTTMKQIAKNDDDQFGRIAKIESTMVKRADCLETQKDIIAKIPPPVPKNGSTSGKTIGVVSALVVVIITLARVLEYIILGGKP